METVLAFVVASMISKITALFVLEYKCRAPRVAFFWAGLVLGWIDVFILFFIILDFSFDKM